MSEIIDTPESGVENETMNLGGAVTQTEREQMDRWALSDFAKNEKGEVIRGASLEKVNADRAVDGLEPIAETETKPESPDPFAVIPETNAASFQLPPLEAETDSAARSLLISGKFDIANGPSFISQLISGNRQFNQMLSNTPTDGQELAIERHFQTQEEMLRNVWADRYETNAETVDGFLTFLSKREDSSFKVLMDSPAVANATVHNHLLGHIKSLESQFGISFGKDSLERLEEKMK